MALNADGEYEIVGEVEGDSVEEVLGYVEYDPEELRRRFGRSVQTAVEENRISLSEREVLELTFEEGLIGYTYFED